MTQSIKGTRAALFAACGTIYAATVDSAGAKALVSYGPPGVFQPGVIVAVMGTRQPIVRPVMSPQRKREKAAEIDVTISVYIPGAEEAQQTAAEACDDLGELLDTYLRTSPNETLGGACRDAWVSNISGPRLDLAVDPKSGAVTGRVAESTATVTAVIRY